MKDLARRYIPQSPDLGLYVTPDIPAAKLDAAIRDYAPGVPSDDVIALYDATLLRTGKDGAIFTGDRLVFQNSNLSAAQEIRYGDIVEVEEERKLLGGRKVILHVNRGQATVQVEIDFSGRPKASQYVKRFLDEAMLVDTARMAEARRGAGVAEMSGSASASGIPSDRQVGTDPEAVAAALRRLVDEGRLSTADFERLVAVLST